MNEKVLLGIIIVFVVFLYLYFCPVEHLKKRVYQLFVEAEKLYSAGGQGMVKMQYVMDMLWNVMPKGIRALIPKTLFRKILERWFLAIKELLHYHWIEASENNESDT